MSKQTIDISDIRLDTPKPEWGGELANIILDLEKLRERISIGTTPKHIYFEIKSIFQLLESLGSARIEGNNTTLSEFTEKIIEKKEPEEDESLAEILNIQEAINFIYDNVTEKTTINKAIITQIHKIVVSNLTREGSKIIGDYRKENLFIKKRDTLQLPDFLQVENLMSDLLDYINQIDKPQNHLLQIAVAHHYFTFIHPFDNGNGRVARLLTFVMLVQYGFNMQGNILNPTAIFCNDRDRYYDMLEKADEGNIQEWCLFVLSGIKEEIEKIEKISGIDYMREILKKVLQDAIDKRYIDNQTHQVLSLIVDNSSMAIQAGDLSYINGMDSTLKRSRFIKKLKEKMFIHGVSGNNSRTYTLCLSKNLLLRSLVEILRGEGFISPSLDK